MDNNIPIFVKIDDFKTITELLQVTHDQLQDVHRILDEIKEIKSKEDTMIQQWTDDIAEVEQSLNEIDNKLSHG